MPTKVPTLSEAKQTATHRADAIDKELAGLEAERAEASVEAVLGKDGAAARLAKIAERIGALVRERSDLDLAREEIEKREAQAKARAEAAERQRLLAEKDQAVDRRNDLYDQVASLVDQAAALGAKCLEADEALARVLWALKEEPEHPTRQSKIRLRTYVDWRFAEAGLRPDFEFPHPARRVHPKNW